MYGSTRRLATAAGLAALLLWGLAAPARALPGAVSDGLAEQARSQGRVRVIVELDLATEAEARLPTPAAVAQQRAAIQARQAQVLTAVAGTPHRMTARFRTIPFLAFETSARALEALEASPRVVRVTEDRPERPLLAQSTPLVEATTAVGAGLDGSGRVVAILDTGVDGSHAFLSGRIVAEACFSDGDCPGGGDSSSAAGSGAPCSYASSGCQHGTHVAGIAAGDGASFDGVAPGAGLIAVQVFSRFTGSSCFGAGENPCALSYISDQILGLEHVYSLRTSFAIAAVNMSLGGGMYTSQAQCDIDQAARKAAIDNLRSAGIATVISSGNEGYTNALGTPACISTAVSVGSTTKSDVVSSFSNSASFLDLLAPGSAINSSVPGGGFASFNGTSMAAPHVTGAWAILKQSDPSVSVTDVLAALTASGVSVTDSRNSLVRPRIRIFQASALVGCGGVDSDSDGTPDGCDVCPQDPLDDADGDGVCGDVDVCPGFDDGLDADSDGAPDGCDVCPQDPLDDADGDGVCGDVDVCPGFDDGLDADSDGTPDGCDVCPQDPLDDADGDGVCGDVDVCPGFDDGLDADSDATPDGCDVCPFDSLDDADGDGLCADADNCPAVTNPFQRDRNGNGVGDLCDPEPFQVPSLSPLGVGLLVALLLGTGVRRRRSG